MDTKSLVAFALMIGIYFYFFAQPASVPRPENQTQTSAAREPAPKPVVAELPKIERDSILLLENDSLALKVSNQGNVVFSELKNFAEALREPARVSKDFGSLGFNRQTIFVDGQEVAGFDAQKSTANALAAVATSGGLRIERTATLDGYTLRFVDKVTNESAKTQEAEMQMVLTYPALTEPNPGFWVRIFSPQAGIREFLFKADGGTQRHPLVPTMSPIQSSGSIHWTGFDDKYFLYAAIPSNFSTENLNFKMLGTGDFFNQVTSLSKTIAPGASETFEYAYYLGPKVLKKLVAVHPDLGAAVNYGDWLGPIARFLLSILLFFYNIIPNFGIAIILLTIVVKVALFPLVFKAAVSMRRLQQVAPKLKALRDKYKDDKVRLNQEMIAMYKSEKLNPVGGCLPILLQMPIFFALYRVFFASIEFRQAPFFGWITDLSQHDHLFVLPILATGLMYLQQKLTPVPPAMDNSEFMQAQMTMMKWMPILFGVFTLFLPAGLSLYILVNVGISAIQQFYLNRHLSLRFPLQDMLESKPAS